VSSNTAHLPEGSHEAIEVLYAQEAESVYKTIRAIVLDHAQAQDLTQETFVRAFKAWDRFDRSNPRAWLLRIATNLAITHYRTEKRRRRVPPWMLLQRSSQDRGPEASEDKDLVSWLMRPLSPDQRALITLHYYQQVPRAEIAELLGIPVGTVASRINKAMQVLRQRAGAWDTAPFPQGGTQ
jgi:RNA polymerase sigma-70 factor, ECF subfamily